MGVTSTPLSHPHQSFRLATPAHFTMLRQLIILAVIAGAVLGDNYLCKPRGAAFRCFENAPRAKFCLTSGAVVCGNCKKKFEFCRTGGASQVSKRPEVDCGGNWRAQACDSYVGPQYA